MKDNYEGKIFKAILITGDIDNSKAIALHNEILGFLETRVCQNCTHFDAIGSCQNEESVLYDEITVDDFGCNEFERGENE